MVHCVGIDGFVWLVELCREPSVAVPYRHFASTILAQQYRLLRHFASTIFAQQYRLFFNTFRKLLFVDDKKEFALPGTGTLPVWGGSEGAKRPSGRRRHLLLYFA